MDGVNNLIAVIQLYKTSIFSNLTQRPRFDLKNKGWNSNKRMCAITLCLQQVLGLKTASDSKLSPGAINPVLHLIFAICCFLPYLSTYIYRRTCAFQNLVWTYISIYMVRYGFSCYDSLCLMS